MQVFFCFFSFVFFYLFAYITETHKQKKGEKMSNMKPSIYTVPEVARLLKVTPSTVRVWVKRKKLKSIQYFDKGKIYIPASEVEKLLEKHQTQEA